MTSLSLGQKVRIVNFPKGDKMDGATGTYMGTSTFDGLIRIMLLDKPLDTHLAITVPASCLEPVEE